MQKALAESLPPQKIVSNIDGSYYSPEANITVPKELAHKLIKYLFQNGYKWAYNKLSSESPEECFDAREKDLNNDGSKEIFIMSGGDHSCGICVSHNCPAWIFKKDKSGWREILTGYAGYLVGLAPLSTKSNFYQDVLTREHSSAVKGFWTVYKFRGKAYQVSSCFVELNTEVDDKVITSYNRVSCR